MTAEPENPLKVFYSYARKDEKLRNELGKHLFSLKRQGLIQDWYDRDISAGKEWAQEIATHLDTSQIILLLISPDFIASDYCYGIEMQRALEKHEAGKARVIPILLRPVDWQDTSLKKLQALPKNAKAVTRWNSKEDAFVEVARGIREAIKELKPLASLTLQPPTAAKEEVIILPSASPPSPSITMQEDQSSVPELAPVWHVPHRRNPFFTGREEILERLHHTFSDMPATSNQPRILSGLGGMGKTQIAIEYAYRYRDDYRTVLWAKADSLEVLNSDFATIAGLLNLPGQREQDQRYAVDVVKRWLEVNTNWLLILDNVEDLKMVIDYLPPAPKGHILLTSQTQVAGGVAFRLEIEKMAAEEGALFLLHRTNMLAQDASLESVPEADRKKAREVIEMMDGLPLAIDQAGAYIEETGCSLAGYLDLYAKRRVELLNLRGGLATDHPKPVATTWSLSFEKIEQTKPAAAELMRFFAFLHPDAIPEELVPKGASPLGSLLKTVASDALTLNETIGELLKYSLLRRNPEAMLTVHRLVQSVLRDTMSTEAQHQWAERTVRAVNLAFPDAEFNLWDDCRRYLPQAQVCAVLIEQEHMTFPEAARLLNEAGHYLYEQGQYPEAEPLLEQAIAIREQTLGPEHPEVATSLNHLAELYREQGKYAPAEILYQQALTIREKLLGPAHVDLATSLNNLGQLEYAQAKYTQAKQLHQRALEMRSNLLGMEHSDVATSLHNLALLYRAEGQYIQAGPLLLQTLEIKEQVLGPEHPDTATSLHNLANLYQAEGQYALARPLVQRALAIYEKVLGPEHPHTATSLDSLARLYQDEGQYALARPLYQRALAIREKVLGPEHPDTATSLNNLASLYQAESQYALARPLFQQALAIYEKVLGPEHPNTATSLNNLALLYQDESQYALARPLFQRALAIREKVLGPEHPDTATSLNNLASLYQDESQYALARPLFQRALAIHEKVLGPEHPHTATSLGNLAGFYTKQRNYAQAETLLQRALSICERTLGPKHPDTIAVLKNYAIMLRQAKRNAKAKDLEKRLKALEEEQALDDKS